MAITVEAIYENGVLKPDKPLPFREHERLQICVQAKPSIARESAGMLPWRGDWETLRRLAEDDEFGILGVAMTFDDLIAPADVFVDANTFIYHFTSDPKWGAACTRLLEWIELQELRGFTATHVMADVAHRLMTIEAMDLLGWPATRLAARLRKHHAQIPKLTVYLQALLRIAQIGVQVLPIVEHHVIGASQLSRAHELLTGDALIVAVMQSHGLTHLASIDNDFDRVPGITRYAPT